jgi:hypothetical protein
MLHNLKHYGVTLGVFSSFVVSKAARGFLSTMALLWEFTPLLWFSKPQEDKTQ